MSDIGLNAYEMEQNFLSAPYKVRSDVADSDKFILGLLNSSNHTRRREILNLVQRVIKRKDTDENTKDDKEKDNASKSTPTKMTSTDRDVSEAWKLKEILPVIVSRMCKILNNERIYGNPDMDSNTKIIMFMGRARDDVAITPMLYALCKIPDILEEAAIGYQKGGIGKGVQSYAYDIVMRLELGDEAFDAMNAKDNHKIRRHWHDFRKVGIRMRELTKEFGIGLTFMAPAHTHWSFFRKARVEQLVNLLKNQKADPDVAIFRRLAGRLDFVEHYYRGTKSMAQFLPTFLDAMSDAVKEMDDRATFLWWFEAMKALRKAAGVGF